jgi:hypothetical protein
VTGPHERYVPLSTAKLVAICVAVCAGCIVAFLAFWQLLWELKPDHEKRPLPHTPTSSSAG